MYTLWRRKWQPTPVLLPGKFHGQRSLVGYSPWGCKESDTTEQLHSCIRLYLPLRDVYNCMYRYMCMHVYAYVYMHTHICVSIFQFCLLRGLEAIAHT